MFVNMSENKKYLQVWVFAQATTALSSSVELASVSVQTEVIIYTKSCQGLKFVFSSFKSISNLLVNIVKAQVL